jgi:PAS domain S-box-containing protein
VKRWLAINNPTTPSPRLQTCRQNSTPCATACRNGFFALDPAWRFTYLNQAAEEILGYGWEELAGQVIWAVLPDTVDLLFAPMQQAWRERTTITFSGRYGRRHSPLDIRIFPSAAGVSVYLRNRREEEAAERALRESEERFRATFEQAAVGIVHSAIDGRLLRVNQRFCDILGYPREELTARTFQEITYPEDLEADLALFRRLLAGELETYMLEKRYVRKDGSLVWVNLTVSLVRAEDGEALYGIAVVEDISERKAVEAASEQRTLQLRALADASLLINRPLSLEERLEIVTEQARQIIGAHQAVTSLTISQNWAQAINAVSLSDKYARWRGYQATPDGSGIYVHVCQTNRPLRLTQAQLEAHPAWRRFSWAHDDHPPMRGWLAAPLIDRHGKNIGLVQLSDKYEGDFNEGDEAILVQLAQFASTAIENAHLVEEAQEAVRVRDTFLSIATHELKTPITVLLGYTNLLQRRKQREGSLNPRDQQLLNTIVEQGWRLNRLILAMLDLSRLQLGTLNLEWTTVDLGALAALVIEELQLLQAERPLRLSLPSTPALVEGDPLRLEQVLYNLVQNALQYSEPAAAVEITIEQDVAAHVARLVVRDQGIGIPADALLHLFERFYRAPNAREQRIGGMGVGLYVVKEIVTLHGGTVEVESVEGSGTTFTIELPLKREV